MNENHSQFANSVQTTRHDFGLSSLTFGSLLWYNEGTFVWESD